MVKKRFCCVIIVLAVVYSLTSAAFAADSREITTVLRKARTAGGKLNSGDKDVIDKFVSESLSEFVDALDHNEMADIRGEIASKSIIKKPSEYSMAFSTALEKGLKPAMAKISNLSDESRKTHLSLNLMMLIAKVESMELAPVSMSMFSDKNAAVRYWAVKSVANSEIASQLKSEVTGDLKLAANIVSAFDNMVNEKTLPEILDLITGFADKLDTPQADALLVRIADVRIKAYESWTVKFEFMDAGLLNALALSIKSGKTEKKSEIAARFGQLYSYAIQRYIFGFETLDSSQKSQLKFVLGDVEQSSVAKLLGRSQSQIKQLLNNSSQRSLDSIGKEHDSLLGSASRAGRLGDQLKYDYGILGSNPVTAPKRLAAPKLEEEE